MFHISTVLHKLIKGVAMKNVGALWKSQTSKGDTMLSGTISAGLFGDINIMIFPNNNKKEKSSQPDYFVAVAGDGKKEEADEL